MSKKIVSTPLGPGAIGPYSQAVRSGNMIFVSGQVAIDPATGKVIEQQDIRAQTQRCLENLLAIVSAAGGSADHVVKTTVFLKDMSDFSEMNEVYAGFFQASRPARSTVEVSRLPRDVAVEIDCIAIVD